MAKTNTGQHKSAIPKSRPGVVSKTKNSKIKGSRNYKKTYRGQGR